MNTVIAPDVFTAANGYTVTKTGMAGRNHVDRYFFRVPAGDPVLKVDLAGPDGNPGTGQVRFLRFHPWGLGVDSNASTRCYAPPVAGCATGDPLSRTVDGADEGVWEVTVEARRTSDTAWAPYTLTASLFGVAVTPNPDVIAERAGRRAGAAVVLAPEQLRAVHRAGSGLAARQRAEGRVHDRRTARRRTTRPRSRPARPRSGRRSEARRTPRRISTSSSTECSDATCTTRTLRGQSADGDAEESVTIANPTAGTWQVEVDGFAIPAGSTTYNYVDIFANPSARLGVGDRRERAASERLIVDGSRLRHGRRDPGNGSRPPRSGQRDDRRRREGRLERGRRRARLAVSAIDRIGRGRLRAAPSPSVLVGLTDSTYYAGDEDRRGGDVREALGESVIWRLVAAGAALGRRGSRLRLSRHRVELAARRTASSGTRSTSRSGERSRTRPRRPMLSRGQSDRCSTRPARSNRRADRAGCPPGRRSRSRAPRAAAIEFTGNGQTNAASPRTAPSAPQPGDCDRGRPARTRPASSSARTTRASASTTAAYAWSLDGGLALGRPDSAVLPGSAARPDSRPTPAWTRRSPGTRRGTHTSPER